MNNLLLLEMDFYKFATSIQGITVFGGLIFFVLGIAILLASQKIGEKNKEQQLKKAYNPVYNQENDK